MRLKKLEISGFKSFANKTNLEFPDTISAIVGPNGSGKSNIVDAVRWVLGEQSFKNLRSKSGADLIWAGNSQKPAVGKAGIGLYFDNSDGFFPIDFGEVIIGRKVYRDGTNEYYLNGSQVRLKDIAELLARSKLGLRGHSIVNQGSADEILKSNPEERREILEESLGLREFQFKKTEAEAKLSETEQNLKQTSNLINEISPHLKSLKRQTEKFEKRGLLISELNSLETNFFKDKILEIFKNRDFNHKAKKEAEIKLAAARRDFEKNDGSFENRIKEASQTGEKIILIDEKIQKINAERHEIMRELGRIEGLVESAKKNNAGNIKTLEAVLAIKIKYWSRRLSAISGIEDIGSIKKAIADLAIEIKTIAGYFEKKEVDRILALVDLADFLDETKSPYNEDKTRLKIKMEELEAKLYKSQKVLSEIRNEENNFRENYINAQKNLELSRRQYFSAQEALGIFDVEEEKIKLKEADVKSELWSSGKNYDDFVKNYFDGGEVKIIRVGTDVPSAAAADMIELENKIIKLRREVAEIGSVDDAVMREYEETNKRYGFLTAESNDLSGAVDSLKNLIVDLTKRVNDDFKAGLDRINSEFNHYFRLMFNGGSARLDREEPGNPAAGVYVSVNVPQKRIRDLNALSGGERSLVSIALLFAIVSVSRPPFLILDEIDAALDEVNAARFSKVLKDLAKDTQFVLITHNRTTMESAKILYGVAMDGDGVSKLFSLKLEEAAV